MTKLDRYLGEIEAIESHPVEQGKVLLYGSSFFAFWGYERAQKQLSEASDGALQVINHGFGGAVVSELLYYYNRLVKPYAPKAIVFRTGHNDVWELSAQEAFTLTKTLFDWAKHDFPNIPLVAMKAFDHPSALPENLEKLHQYNEMLEALAQQDPQLRLLDMNPFLYEKEGVFRDVFREDGLHLTDAGYEQAKHYLAQNLLKLL